MCLIREEGAISETGETPVGFRAVHRGRCEQGVRGWRPQVFSLGRSGSRPPTGSSRPRRSRRTSSLAVTDKDGDRVVGVATATSMRYEYYRSGNTSSTPDAVTEIPKS